MSRSRGGRTAVQLSCTVQALQLARVAVTSIPNLRLNHLLLNLYGLRGKLDTDRRLRLSVELIAREPCQKV